ncbi:hypothetical protein O4H61_03010 [Roseovarius aestuarii]|nr:hypothetical protein [Roseovarius aestuarii]
MQNITGGYRGLGLLVDLNVDRLIYLGAIAAGLFGAAYIVSM